MSGAIWVKDQLRLAGWLGRGRPRAQGQGHRPACSARPTRSTPEFSPSLRRRPRAGGLGGVAEDRAIRERLRRRAHLVQVPDAARNRMFGLLTQFGLRISFTRLRQPDAIELLQRRGVSPARRDSISEHFPKSMRSSVGSDRSTRELAPIAPRTQGLAAADDPRRRAADQPHLRLGDRRRAPASPRPRSWSATPVSRRGSSSRASARRPGGNRRPARGRFRWAAVEAANQAWRPTNPFHHDDRRLAARHGKNPAKSAVARKLLICSWHMLSRNQVFQPHRSTTAAASSLRFLAA